MIKPISILWLHELNRKPAIPGFLLSQEFQVNTTSLDLPPLAVLHERRFDVLCYECEQPTQRDATLLREILAEDPATKVILLLSPSAMDLAVTDFGDIVHHFLPKPVHEGLFRSALLHAAKAHVVSQENERLREQIRDESQHEYVLGKGPVMEKVWSTVRKVGPSDVPVLIEGETGTGKEVVARVLFESSLRREGPFVAMNCAALSKELIESELFGHVRGAFTGAVENKKGRFEMADGGTIFLDEIGEIPMDLQPKLLRVLQDGSFQRVGDTATRKANVRVLAATNRNLKTAIQEQRFREDLYFRLNVVHLYLPPLRERREDIPDLIEYFIARITTQRGQARLQLNTEAQDFLLHYAYPGNIRELQNMLERASLLCSTGQIKLDDMLTPVSFQMYKTRNDPAVPMKPAQPEITKLSDAREQFEMYHLMHLLTLTKGNISQAARLAGIHRNNFKDKMKKFGLQSLPFKE